MTWNHGAHQGTHAIGVVRLLIALTLPAVVSAQSPDRVSGQVAAFSTLISANGRRTIGAGLEPQIRVNGPAVGETGTLSFGLGSQVTQHFVTDGRLTLTGVLVEPRLTFAEDNVSVAWYGSARVGVLQQRSSVASSSSGYSVGLGGGLIKPLRSHKHTNLDAGVGAVYQDFADARTPSGRLYRFAGSVGFVARLGVNVGF